MYAFITVGHSTLSLVRLLERIAIVIVQSIQYFYNKIKVDQDLTCRGMQVG